MLQSNEIVYSNTQLCVSATQSIDLTNVERISIQPVYTDATPAAKTFVAANVTPAADTITITAHGFVTGLKAPLTGTNLPTGLSATDYWIIRVDANTIKLATSLANALAGTAVDITAAGTTADAALTPSALGSNTLKLQASNDDTNYSDLSGLTVTISAAGNQVWNIDRPAYKYVRLSYTPGAGLLNLSVRAVIR